MKSSESFLAKLEENIANATGQLQKLESAKPVDEVTVEDVYELHPEYRERIKQAIKADDWSVAAGEKEAKEAKEKTGSAVKTRDSLTLDYLQ
jgi:ribosome-binding protein aMBF1 (putative translation factor)